MPARVPSGLSPFPGGWWGVGGCWGGRRVRAPRLLEVGIVVVADEVEAVALALQRTPGPEEDTTWNRAQ